MMGEANQANHASLGAVLMAASGGQGTYLGALQEALSRQQVRDASTAWIFLIRALPFKVRDPCAVSSPIFYLRRRCQV